MLEAYSSWPPSRPGRRRVGWGRSSPAFTYRNPALLARPGPRSTSSRAARDPGDGRGLERVGAPTATASSSRGSASGWTAWTRRSRSADACSPRSGPRSRGASTGSTAALNRRGPVQAGGRASSSAAAASSGRFASSRATPITPTGSRSEWTVLRHKTELLDRYCEEIGRDPGTIASVTMAAPVLLVADEREGEARLAGIPRSDGRPRSGDAGARRRDPRGRTSDAGLRRLHVRQHDAGASRWISPGS